MSICVDSNIVIWGIKKQSSPSQLEMIDRAERFFKHASINRIDIIIPTAVIAEILAPEPPENHTRYLQIFNTSFVVGDFDIRVAKKVADLMRDKIPDLKGYLTENKIVRDKMKFDMVIVATAIIYGSNCIYSDDPHLHTIGKNLIRVEKLPDIKVIEQPIIQVTGSSDLFGNSVKIKDKKKR